MAPEAPRPLLESIGTLKEYRVKAEHWAGVLKGLEPTLSKSEARQGVTNYVEGKAAIDGWLEQMIAELEAGGGTTPSPRQQQALEQAALKAKTFMDYVAALGQDQKRGDWLGVVPAAIAAVVEAGVTLWREFRSVSREQRQALITRLEALRWPAFESIEAK
jgi:hypothetical protein